MEDDRTYQDLPSPRPPGPLRLGRWTFEPADEPGLNALPYHHDELLLPVSGDPTRAEHVLRRRRITTEYYVRGVVLHDLQPPLALAGWHRARRDAI